jgi:hypothetical protein
MANSPEVQVLYDNGRETMIKVIGYYSASESDFTIIANTKALAFANTSKTCIVSISKIQYVCDCSTGAISLYWQGQSSNTNVAYFGTSSCGTINAFIPNNASNPTGNIGLQTLGLVANDSYSLFITLNKEPTDGYANAYIQYNGDKFHP